MFNIQWNMVKLFQYFLVIYLMLVTGCGSIAATAFDGNPKIYEGVQAEIIILKGPQSNILLRILVCMDFIPTCLMDTILLPYTGTCELLFNIDDTSPKSTTSNNE